MDPSELQAQGSHVQQGDVGEGAGQEGEVEGPGPLPPSGTGEAAEQEAFYGAGELYTHDRHLASSARQSLPRTNTQLMSVPYLHYFYLCQAPKL